MNRKDTKKYHHYSLAFYGKDNSLFETSNRAKLGFANLSQYEKILKPKSIELFTKFGSENKTDQANLLNEDSESYLEAMMDVINGMRANRDLMEFALPTIDAILTERNDVLRDMLQLRGRDSFLQSLKSFLFEMDHRAAATEAAVHILSLVYGEIDNSSERKSFLLDIIHINRDDKRPHLSDFCLVSSIVNIIKHEDMCKVFIKNGGVELLIDCLNRNSSDLQIVYYCFLNFWLVSFLDEAYPSYLSVPKFGIIRLICEVLQKISRDKLVRVAFYIFKNLQKNHECLELMMDVGLLKIIDTLLKGNIKDKEVIEDIKEIGTTLESNIKVLSSFDKYSKQLNAECLEWSAVHTDRFWKENALKFEDSDYQMIKKLSTLLTSQRQKNVAIACYDLGEFCRFYPHGRNILQSLKIKDIIMQKAKKSEDKAVREQALLALQKIMIQNWQAI